VTQPSTTHEHATYHEIVTQSLAWQDALDQVHAHADALRALWAEKRFAQVVCTGCGSTYYLALAAAAQLQAWTGVFARGVPAGELNMVPETAYAEGETLLLALSRSAGTTETVQAARAFRDRGGDAVLVITNYGERPLARLGTLTVAIPAGQERSIAQTRSFASMFVAATALAAVVAGREDLFSAMGRLPEIGEGLIARYASLAQEVGQDLDLDRFYFLGSGPRYGLACEANLKMKEMTLTHSEPFHFLEFRHGPKAMVGRTTLVAGLLSEACRRYEAPVLEEMRGLGARVLSLAEADADVAFASQLPAAVRNVLYLPVLQLVAYYRTLAKGLNPDEPTHLDAVVELDWE
jgi:glucosamine--fructose-6-phosphate aminotransferase (isomerizing)